MRQPMPPSLPALRGEPPEQEAEERVPPRRQRVGARVRQERRDAGPAARRVATVDEIAERIEERVLAQRHPEGEPARLGGDPPPRLVVDEPESRPVRDVNDEPGRPPEPAARERLAEYGYVRVVAANEPSVERLLHGPCGRGCRPGG